MKNNEIKNSYLVSCVYSILIMMMISYFGLNLAVKETFAGFGGLSGCMLPTIKVNYIPNYPDDIPAPEIYVKMSCEAHKVLNSMFEAPFGYEFNGWNTMPDGSGNNLNIGVFTMISEETTIYAQWKKLPQEEPEEEIIKYGDVDQDSQIDEEDYLLIEKYLSDSSILTDDLLIVADVNGDGKIDEVDVDIIKQVCLGTSGYLDYLPDKIVPIYSVYDDDESTDNEEQPGGNNGTSDGSGTGNGTGSENTSGGSGSNGGTNNNGSSSDKPSNNKPNNNSGSNTNREPEENKEEIVEPKKVVYKFSFINDNKEYDITSCETIEGNACEVILPKKNPTKENAIFSGWDTDKECTSVNKINKPFLIKNSGTYYACFIVNASVKKDYNIFTVGLIILSIWVCASFIIYLLVKRFKDMEIKTRD